MKVLVFAAIVLAFVGIGMGPAKAGKLEKAQANPTQVVDAMSKAMATAFESHHDQCVGYMFTDPIADTVELMLSEYSRCMGEHYLIFETYLINQHHEKYLEN